MDDMIVFNISPFMGCRQVVRQQVLALLFGGSSPSTPALRNQPK
jgi:hypothetical protein